RRRNDDESDIALLDGKFIIGRRADTVPALVDQLLQACLVNRSPALGQRGDEFTVNVEPDDLETPMSKNCYHRCTEFTQANDRKPRRVVMHSSTLYQSIHRTTIVRRPKAQIARLHFLPHYMPDLNPVEIVCSKLKSLRERFAGRSFDD